MEIVVSSIVEVSMKKIALWIIVGVDDWTVQNTITAIKKKRNSQTAFRAVKSENNRFKFNKDMNKNVFQSAAVAVSGGVCPGVSAQGVSAKGVSAQG